ncbi:efflux RND transporter periplasmic adaptor subunit [Jiella sp. MQZ9-1]|uniref:Efflux RND transporter periplasmic adaptor subunit n=1 Tax=Jiella flava TaxID=2816857 RepID=A0A939FW97_9HYPH|nr:efflux RND transporter periplasmic adaptor subunit [Jiella flava]MBO0661936.1 efflux RND transporter periplasmic adaptor subunit [Jiella flava]MCD2470736.1 efflux RND transporter periplasmic adaptor subunit [Jiella flava]
MKRQVVSNKFHPASLAPRRTGRVLAVALMTMALAACSESGESGGKGQAAAHGGHGRSGPVKVGVMTIEPQPVVITAHVAGRVVAFKTADVRPQVGGLLTEQLFEEGTEVKKGQVLYKLDDKSYKAEVDSAEATLQKNEAAAESAKLQYERYKNLSASNVVSKQNLDDSLSTYRQAQADIAVAQAALETAKLNLNYTSIEAPISGRVGTNTANPGNLVTANQSTALATIRQIDPVYVDFTESSGNLLKFRDQIRKGGLQPLVGPAHKGHTQVSIQFADGSSYNETGTIDAADQFVSQTTSSFTVRTRFPNPHNVLLPGMYVRGTIRLAIDEKGLLLPQRAVSRNQKGDPVAMFVKPDGTAEERVLDASTDIGTNWLVTKGVAAGDKLIVDGLQKVRAGAKVETVAVTIDAKGLAVPVTKGDGKAATPAMATDEMTMDETPSATAAASAGAAAKPSPPQPRGEAAAATPASAKIGNAQGAGNAQGSDTGGAKSAARGAKE